MKPRALAFLGRARSLLDDHPPAMAYSAHLYIGGLWVPIYAPTDDSVEILATDLGLGPVEERMRGGRKWCRALAEHGGVRIEVIGPDRIITPSGASANGRTQ